MPTIKKMNTSFDRSHRHYYHAVLFAWGFSLLLCIADVSYAAIAYALGAKTWLDIIGAAFLAPFYITLLLSGFTYISRVIQSVEQALKAQETLELSTSKKITLSLKEELALKDEQKLAWLNAIWTLCGALLGVVVSIAMLVDPFDKELKQDHFNYVAYFLCVLTGIAWGSGLTNRMVAKGRPLYEKWGMRIGVLLGTGIALALFYGNILPTLGVPGFIGVYISNLSFMPIAAVFFPTFISFAGSVSDYVVKVSEFCVCHYWKMRKMRDTLPEQNQQLYDRVIGIGCTDDPLVDRHEEYWGTVLGAIIGLSIGGGTLAVFLLKPALLSIAHLEIGGAIIFIFTGFIGGAAAGSRTGNAIIYNRQEKLAPPLHKQMHKEETKPLIASLTTTNSEEDIRSTSTPTPVTPKLPPGYVEPTSPLNANPRIYYSTSSPFGGSSLEKIPTSPPSSDITM